MDESAILPKAPLRVIGRYALYEPIAAGGMGTVHLGKLLGPAGFSRTVAIKRSHPEMAADPDFVSMFLDEARLAARIRHPNVVSTLDVVALEGELFLVMDFVQGESLSRLLRTMKTLDQKIPPPIACTMLAGALHGLHAAHEAKSERGEPLRIVHRDVSPQNILIGIDGIARVLDFGVAKAVGRVATTREGQIKGKLSYLAPEQLTGEVGRQSDVYAASVVLWEALTSERLFVADNPGELLNLILHRKVPPPSERASGISPALDAIVQKGLARDPADRFATAREMAIELERNGGQVSAVEVGEWVERVARDAIVSRATKIAEIEHPTRVEAVDRTATVAEGRLVPAPERESMASIAKDPSTDPRRRRVGWVAAGAALVLLAAVVTARTTRFVRAPSGEDRPQTTSPEPAALSPRDPAPAAPQPRDPTPPIAAPDSLTEMKPAEPVPVVRSKPAPRRPPKKTVDCSFPYIVDGAGIQHIRKECLN